MNSTKKKHWISVFLRSISIFVIVILIPLTAGLNFGKKISDKMWSLQTSQLSTPSSQPQPEFRLENYKKNKYLSSQDIGLLVEQMRVSEPYFEKDTSADKKNSVKVTRKIRINNLENEMKNRQINYTLQYSSHQSQSDAQTTLARLRKKHLPAFIEEANVHSQTWYRVYIGQFATTKKAEEYNQKINKEAGIAATFIQNLNK
ncbi:MAG: SPOR domain-containing protein [Bdellovibrionales bacterium]|nr:SPOR domain-containing protein [Bdellovibrionales bacterium]